MPSNHKINLLPSHILIISFASVILVGTGLLMAPFSTIGTPLSFLDSLFMATSATCVTGLSIVDIGTKLTITGQMILLVLIQLGGLGIMTFSTIIIFFTGKHIPLKEKTILKDSFMQFSASELFRLIRYVFFLTFFLELVGACFFFIRWSNEFPLKKALYYSVFHSISAFCNAGFSLFADGFVQYKADPLISLTTVCLIVLGGLGFFVIVELKDLCFKKLETKAKKKLTLHSKMVLTCSAILIIAGTISFFILENDNVLKGDTLTTKIICSLFQSVTTRTAGFATVDFGSVTNTFLFISLLFMFVGASSGSTGGGIKTTCVGILFAMVKARIKARDDVSLFKRTITPDTIKKAVSIIFVSILVTGILYICLLISETGSTSLADSKGSFLEILFETVSAFGTVGLSTGYTSKLTGTGRVLITIMMFIGRLGPLTMAAAISRTRPKGVFQYSEESVMIG